MPLDTVLCLDTSGSMAGRGMKELKNAVTHFIEGVEETAKEGLKENIAVVEFGKNEKIVQGLTNDYAKIKKAVDGLQAGGRTPMFGGLTKAMEEIIEHGGVVRIAGRALSPRIILMTDGVPTDENGETMEAKLKVLSVAAVFGQNWREVGLPHPIPIACVGCGDCDAELLEAIAKLTNGMFVIVENVSELSGFFRRQVLLIKFAAKFASDMGKLRDILVLRQFMAALGEDVDDSELEGLMGLLIAMMGLEAAAGLAAAEAGSGSGGTMPPRGCRVRRGKDWKWGAQDGNGVGTVVEHKGKGVVSVEWDSGSTNSYRMGAEGAMDLKIVDEPRILKPGESIKVGCNVKRGRDWKWGDQDGGASKVGVVFCVGADKRVKVRWPNGTMADYRYGRDGCYDVTIIGSSSLSPRSSPARSSPVPPASTPSPRSDQILCWQWKDDNNIWRLFQKDVSKKMESAYKDNNKGNCKLQFNRFNYVMKFDTMRQVNESTKKERPIQRVALSRDDYELAEAVEKSLSVSE